MKVVFEDKEIIVVEKSAGEVVHSAPGYEDGTMSDLLKVRYPEIANVGSRERPGVVHRLDKDTSGVMVFARNQKSYLALRKLFESHVGVEKAYIAVCHGAPKGRKGTLDSLIGRNHLRAISHWELLQKKGGVSLIKFDIETGRMHQVRIHAAELGCPIIGDSIYGSREKDSHLRRRPTRTLLHAVRLAFKHPTTGRFVEFLAEPPADIVYAV